MPLRSDDHGDTPATATVLPSTFRVAGVLRDRADVDAFRLEAGSGTLSVRADPAYSTNVDLKMTLVDAGGKTLAVADPSGVAAPQIDVTVAAGTYYVLVDGVGAGDLSTGYSDYASLGRFVLSGNVAAPEGSATSPPPPTESSTTTSSTTTSTTTTSTSTSTTSTTSTTTVAPKPIAVTSLELRRGTGKNTAVADAMVLDADGSPVAGAVVYGQWTGLSKASTKGQTDQTGKATTPNTKLKGSGALTFTVTSVAAPAGSNFVWNGTKSSVTAQF